MITKKTKHSPFSKEETERFDKAISKGICEIWRQALYVEEHCDIKNLIYLAFFAFMYINFIDSAFKTYGLVEGSKDDNFLATVGSWSYIANGASKILMP